MSLLRKWGLTCGGELREASGLDGPSWGNDGVLLPRHQAIGRIPQAALLETDPAAWEPPDPELEALAVEIDEVMYGRRREMPGLVERIAGVLGDDWEP